MSTVSLQLQENRLRLIYGSTKKNELRRAEEELRGLLKYQIIPVESGYDEILEEQEWQKLREKVESGGKLCILQNVSTKYFCGL